jgi:hypothetical protein
VSGWNIVIVDDLLTSNLESMLSGMGSAAKRTEVDDLKRELAKRWLGPITILPGVIKTTTVTGGFIASKTGECPCGGTWGVCEYHK